MLQIAEEQRVALMPLTSPIKSNLNAIIPPDGIALLHGAVTCLRVALHRVQSRSLPRGFH
jgi:hypothetical protein